MDAPAHHGNESAVARGEVVAGRYRVIAPMGEGGMATVHRAEEVGTGRPVALKVLRPELGRNAEAVERLRREAEILAHLRHPAIVAVERSGALPNGQLFLCMELLEGETLGDRLRRGRMDVDELAPLVAGTTAGLAAAHALGVIHRDLKPDNVFLVRSAAGAPSNVKLLDFGISKVVGFDRITRTGQVLGTPRYMAPEQLTADGDLDARVDVYALGAILYEALAGQAAFPATDPSALIVSILNGDVVPLGSLRPDLPPEITALVARAMARAPEARHASAAELGAAFAQLSAASAAVESRSRFQMRTSALGAMPGISSPAAPDTPSGAPPPEPFKPGTFSEFAPMQAVPGALVDAAAAPMEAPRPEGGGSARSVEPAAAANAPMFSTPRTLFSREPPQWAAVGSVLAALLGFALVAGALGSGAILWYLRSRPSGQSSSAPPVAPPSSQGVASGATAPPTNAPMPTSTLPEPSAPAEPALTSGSGARPHGSSVAHGEESAPEPPRDGSDARRRALRGSGPSATEDAVPPPYVQVRPASREEPARDGAAGPLRAARDRQRAGDVAGCIELGLSAIDLGAGPTAYLLLGDCYSAAGQLDRAGKAYERFCRAMPSHPAVRRVVGRVTSAGGRCD